MGSIYPHIKEAQEGWYPGQEGFTALEDNMRKVDLSRLHWVECAQALEDKTTFEKRPFGRINEEIFIPECHPDFEPILSPMRMLNMGVFGNAYFGSMQEGTSYPLGKERWELLPEHKLLNEYEGFDKAKWKTAYFQKKASMTRAWWIERKLIADCDPLGWFEWYCWYWLGRRIPSEDAHQIGRWVNYRSRQSAMLEARPTAIGLKQALLHWSVDPWIVD